jgi:GntR family transcriptional repressor for pyruvate dehydrogenase complex
MTETSEKFERIGTVPAYQLVAEAIEREIFAGRIRAGQPIGSEAALAKRFQVNRSTVREGIRLLEYGGLIERDSSRRLFASLPHYNELATRISRALVLHEVTFRELFEAALAIETDIIEQAVNQATRHDIAALEINVAQTECAIDDPVAIAKLETEFHELIAKSAGNRILVLAGEPVRLMIRPTTELILGENLKEGGPRVLAAHRMYVDALRRHDAAAGRDWVRRHLWDWRKGFERVGRELDQPVDCVYDRHRTRNADSR